MITINRPERLNAVTPAIAGRLESAFLELEADSSVRAVVLGGAGRGLCAGADDAGMTWLLPRIVGLGRANELALLGRDLAASEAREWGLVNQLSTDGEALTDAIAMARRFAELSVSVASIKQAHHRSLESDFASHLQYEADTQGWLQQQPDFAEATRAFADKRPARFSERTPPARTG